MPAQLPPVISPYLLNINDELKITCGKYSRETTRGSHSVSVIKCSGASDCFTQSIEIQLIGSHSNCSYNGNFIIYHTLNFVTEWLHNKLVMPYYRENKHILCLLSKTVYKPSMLFNKTYQVCLVKIMCHKFHLNSQTISQVISSKSQTKQDKTKHFSKNPQTTTLKTQTNYLTSIHESSMIFIFVSCIIALLAFILRIFLCFKHENLRKLISVYMASHQVVNATNVYTSCNTDNIFQYILSTICILILTYAIIKRIIRGCQYFCRYLTTSPFFCQHGHDKGPSTVNVL